MFFLFGSVIFFRISFGGLKAGVDVGMEYPDFIIEIVG